MERTRVALVSQWFPPEPDAAPLWIAEGLRDQGLEVGVITGVPHYPTGVPVAGHSPTDRRLDVVRGFRTLRVPEYPSHDTSSLRRTATFASFALSSAGLATRAIGRAEVSLVYSSPATSALPAMVARAQHGTPYVLLVQDLWPDSIFATGFLTEGAVRRAAECAIGAFVDVGYRSASHICVITPGIRRILIDRGVPEKKITVVYNWVDESVIAPAPSSGEIRRQLGIAPGDFVALYAGNMGEAQGLGAWIKAMGLVRDLHDAHLLFLGGGTQRVELESLAAKVGVAGHTHFLDAVPARDVPALTADSDVSIVSLADRELFRITMPSKIQAALAMGRPVIASADGDVADLIVESGAGWVAAPEDPQSIAAAIRQARAAGSSQLQRRGQAGHRFYHQNMGREIGSARLASVLRIATEDRKRRRAAVLSPARRRLAPRLQGGVP